MNKAYEEMLKIVRRFEQWRKDPSIARSYKEFRAEMVAKQLSRYEPTDTEAIVQDRFEYGYYNETGGEIGDIDWPV